MLTSQLKDFASKRERSEQPPYRASGVALQEENTLLANFIRTDIVFGVPDARVVAS